MIGRLRARAHEKLSIGGRRDDGFTLIELLVVLVILPLIIGAVAEAIIVSFENEPSTSNRLSDTTNAALTTEYFVRDVQGATEVTTNQQLFQAAGYSEYSPQVCGATSSDTLLVALYRPPADGAAPLDVAYWTHTQENSTVQIIRYSCTLQADYSSTSPDGEVLAGPPPGTLAGNADPANQVSATVSITPDQFVQPAATGWASTFAQTAVSNAIPALSGAPTISVASVAGVSSVPGFAPGPISISTSLGDQTANCSGVATSSFTGCTATSAAAVGVGALVTQANLSSVQLAVTEPSSSYTFNILGTPRAAPSAGSPPGSGGPALLALGSAGIQVTGSGSYVGGAVVSDGGLACPSATYASGTMASAAIQSPTCNGGIVPTPPVPDPLASSMPACFQTSRFLPSDPDPDSNNYEVPGIYMSDPINGTLEPGVYVAEDGVGSVTSAPPSAGDRYFSENTSHTYDPTSGVLIYIPGPGPYPAGCITVPSDANATFNGAEATVVPLNAAQSSYYFFGNPSLGDMALWIDKTNSTATNQTFSFCSGNVFDPSFSAQCQQPHASKSVVYGLIYAPSSTLDGSFSLGKMIVAGVQTPSSEIRLTGG